MTKTTRKSLIAICIVILLVAACFAVMPKALAFAAEASSDEVSPLNVNALFAGGTGTKDDPYLIENETQLKNIRSLLTYDSASQTMRITQSFKLISTILITSKWSPIGGYFDGSLDGNNYSIDELKIEVTTAAGLYFGLFQQIGSKGSVHHLNLTGLSVTYPSQATSDEIYYVGGIAGRNRGAISNCKVRGNLDATNAYNAAIGSYVGINESSIISCENYANVTGSGYVGGIVGLNDSGGYIYGCKNFGTISYSREKEDRCAAGIVGKSISSTVSSCDNNGTIKYVGKWVITAIRPCMAQIIGWITDGTFSNNTYDGKCEYKNLTGKQTTYCSDGEVGRAGS